MKYTDEEKSNFTRAKEVYLTAVEDGLRAHREDLQSIFAWQDAYIAAFEGNRARPEELDRFIGQADFVREQREAEAGVGAVDGVPFSPGFESSTPVDLTDDVGWWPGFGPSDESKKTFALASTRLDELLAWGVSGKLPHRKLTIDKLTAYRAAFKKGDADLSHLGGYKDDIESLAKEAAEKGFVIKGGALPSVDVESVSAANAAAAATVQAQKDAAKAIVESGQSVFGGIGKMFEAIPTSVKLVGGGVVLLLGGIFAAAFGKERGRR